MKFPDLINPVLQYQTKNLWVSLPVWLLVQSIKMVLVILEKLECGVNASGQSNNTVGYNNMIYQVIISVTSLYNEKEVEEKELTCFVLLTCDWELR